MEFTSTITSILTGRNSLIDTKLDEILISTNNENDLQIRLTFINFRKESDFDKIKILFKNIEEFSFYHNKDYIFYNIENYKLLNLEGKIYISLDPDDSTISRSLDDSDFIFCEKATILF